MLTERKRPIRNTTIDAVILHNLMDGKIHKLQELASHAEVCIRTVQRSIFRLGLYFIIHTFTGGREKGGVYLDTRHIYFGLTKDKY